MVETEAAKQPVVTTSLTDSASSHPQEEPQIDGGIKAWSVVAGAWCCLFCAFGWVNAIGVFQDYYQQNQLKDCSPSSISWILSLEPFVLFAAGLLIGKLFDNFGPRWLLVAGTFLHVFGLMMMSLSSQYYQLLLAQGICSPLGASFVFYAALSSTATWLRERKALAFGIVSSGSSLGGVIFPIVLSRTLPAVGFGWSVRICGFIILCMLLIANMTVHSRIPPSPRRTTPDDYFGPFREAPFVLLTLAASCGFFAMFVPINYVVLQAQTEGGVSPQLAGYLLAILNAGSLPGRILPGYLGDRLGRFNVMMAMCAASALVILLLWLPGSLLTRSGSGSAAAVYVVFSALYGFASGAFVGMVPALLGQISPDVSRIGTRQGVLFTCLAVASLCGSPIAGAILNAKGGGSAFWGLQVFAGGMMVGAVFFFGVCRVVLAGWGLTTKV